MQSQIIDIASDKDHKKWLRIIARKQWPVTLKIVREVCNYFRSIFPDSGDKRLDPLIKRYRQMVIYASELIVDNLLSAEKPSKNRPINRDKQPRPYGMRHQKHTWRAGNGLLKRLREIPDSLFNEVETLERLILFPTKEDKELMFVPGRESLNYRPEDFMHFFEDLLDQIDLTIKDSKTLTRLEKSMDSAHEERSKRAKNERNNPDSRFNQVLRLNEQYKKSKTEWKADRRVSEIAAVLDISKRQVYKLLSKEQTNKSTSNH